MPFEVEHQVEIPIDVFLRAKLKELEVAEVPYTDKKTGERKTFKKLNWVFEILENGEFWGKTVRAETPAYLSDGPNNQFRLWAEALLKRELDLGQVLNESDLVGLQGLIVCKREQDRKDENKYWTRVADVIPADPAGDDPPF